MTTKELGNLGEKIACEYLVGKGYDILCRNYKIKFGEIDIIARKKWQLRNIFRQNPSTGSGQAIHFVEVKTIKRSDGFFPEQRADWKKQQKVRNLAQIWLSKNKMPAETPYQIDIIGITINEETRRARLRYFPNAVADRQKV